MRHQVERLKHVALRQGVKPARALTAALVAVGMMATAAISFVLPPTSANADDGHDDGKVFVPSSITMGDSGASTNDIDTGLATFVGRDFYVGKPKSGDTQSLNENSIDGSWAAEMEGQTFIRGRYMQRAQKGFFTIGTVAFGAQYLPSNNSTIIAVEGKNSAFNSNVQSIVQAWNSTASGVTQQQGAGIQQTDRGDKGKTNFDTKLAGPMTKLWGTSSSDGTIKKQSIYKYGFNGVGDSAASWDQTDFSDVKDGQGNAIGEYGTKVSTDSETLKKMPANGTVTFADAPAQNNYERRKYDYDKYDAFAKNESEKNAGKTIWKNNTYGETSFSTYKVTMNFQSGDERLAVFNGDGTSSMQIFEIKASDLNSDKGLDFWFRNIPDNASVLVNVVDDTTGVKTPITMRTGWRFWWGGSNASDPISANATEISNGYVTGDTNSALYSKVAQKIMWNFADSSSVTVKGGKASNVTVSRLHADNADWWYTSTESISNSSVDDDPSADLLGSIMVPNGSLESHVTTNGRVYVGEDFCMYNPTQAKHKGSYINSASIIDMDQERHNFPWGGQFNAQGVRIQWNKVDENGNALVGTTWAVYGSKNDAMNNTNALLTVTDNGAGDADSMAGTIQPMVDLTANATYYLKETASVSGYMLNTNIYRILAGDAGKTYSTIDKVYDANSDITADTGKNLLSNGAVVNKATGSSLEWSKVDADDTDTRLAGSTWNLTKYTDENRTNAESGWPKSIHDTTVAVTGVSIVGSDGTAYANGQDVGDKAVNNVFTLSATVTPSGAPSGVVWTSSNDDYATVDAGSGIVTPKSNSGNDYVSITACSTSNTNVCSSVKFKVTGATAAKVTVAPSTVTVVEGKTTQLTATVNPQQDVTWSSNNELVARVDQNGLVTGVSAGTATVTASTADGVSASAEITVTSAQQYLTLYFDSNNQGTWSASNVQVYYRTKSNVWVPQNMTQMSGSCGQYAYAQIPMDDINVSSQFGFRHLDGSEWYGPGNANVPKSDGNFKFTSGATLPENVTISAGPNYSATAPNGCTVSASTRSAKSAKAVRKAATKTSGTSRAANAAQDELKDEDTDPGAFRISNLADGYYVLKEIGEPNGFDIGGTYKITIEGGKITWDPAMEGNKLPNTRKTGTVTWNKVNKTDGTKLLGGSEWTLTKTKRFSWDNGTAKYTTVTDPTSQTITDCVNGKGGVDNCSAQSGQYVDLNGDQGKFELRGLDWGEYQLVETKAPDGYDLDSTPHKFRIGPAEGSDVTGEWYTSSGFKTDTTGAYNANTAFTVDGGSITNTPGVVLPSTGGEGLNKMYTAGFLAVAIAVAGLALSLRRRQS
ncbi:MAG: Ig-like domain-containing protein [Bifidobacterium sp.]|nr:Ig-like domain-containing protein [Bifidobacterium sp.]